MHRILWLIKIRVCMSIYGVSMLVRDGRQVQEVVGEISLSLLYNCTSLLFCMLPCHILTACIHIYVILLCSNNIVQCL